MRDSPRHSVSVAGVIVDELDQVLLIRRRDNNEWQAPGGVLELPETFEEGVYREVLEETGLQVAVERLTGVYKNLPRGVVALVFRCRPTGGSPTPTSEAAEVCWVSTEEAISRMTPAFAVRIQDAVSPPDATGVASRTHNGITLL